MSLYTSHAVIPDVPIVAAYPRTRIIAIAHPTMKSIFLRTYLW